MEPLLKKLTSRKFLGTVLVLATIFLNSFGITSLETAELFALSASVAAFVLGESALDRERIRATQLVNLENAEKVAQKLVIDGNAIISAKDEMITDLERLLDAADGPDPRTIDPGGPVPTV